MLPACFFFALAAIFAGIFSLRLARSQWNGFMRNQTWMDAAKEESKKQSIVRFQKKRFRRRTVIGMALIFVGALMPVAMHFLSNNPPLGVMLWTALFFVIVIIVGLGIVDAFAAYSLKLQLEQDYYLQNAMKHIRKALREQEESQHPSSDKQNS